MKKLPKIITRILSLLSIVPVCSFLLMSVNIMLYYGFQPSVIHSPPQPNPFHLAVGTIWAIHLAAGFLGGISLAKKRYGLAGTMGLLCAALITGVSFAYFGWRSSLISVEVLIPLVAGILPTMKMNDYLKDRMDARAKKHPGPSYEQ